MKFLIFVPVLLVSSISLAITVDQQRDLALERLKITKTSNGLNFDNAVVGGSVCYGADTEKRLHVFVSMGVWTGHSWYDDRDFDDPMNWQQNYDIVPDTVMDARRAVMDKSDSATPVSIDFVGAEDTRINFDSDGKNVTSAKQVWIKHTDDEESSVYSEDNVTFTINMFDKPADMRASRKYMLKAAYARDDAQAAKDGEGERFNDVQDDDNYTLKMDPKDECSKRSFTQHVKDAVSFSFAGHKAHNIERRFHCFTYNNGRTNNLLGYILPTK